MTMTTEEPRCEHHQGVHVNKAWTGFRHSADELADACGHAVRGFVGKVAPHEDPYSPGIAAVLSFLIPGLGQAYNGQVGKGVLFLLGWVLVIPWALAVMDAYYSARVKNLEFRLSCADRHH